jgi:hypothetical protein
MASCSFIPRSTEVSKLVHTPNEETPTDNRVMSYSYFLSLTKESRRKVIQNLKVNDNKSIYYVNTASL